MAVAGLPPTLPPGPLPVPVPQVVPLPAFPPQQALPQPVYPSFYAPAYHPQPQALPQPPRQPSQSLPVRWGSYTKPRRPVTGNPNLKSLRKQNRHKTREAAAAGGFVNGSTRPCQRLPARHARQQSTNGPGVHQQAFKRAWKFPPAARRNHRQGKAQKKRNQAPPPRAQTPWSIQHTPASIQRTPSAVQLTPARPEGAPVWSPSHDHEILLRPDGPLARRRRLSDGVFGSGLDYFGTNQGLILRSDVTSSSSAGSEADDSNSDSEPAQDCELHLASTAAAPLPQHVQTHINDQSEQIAQLEVDNAKLSDENINLKERIFLLEKEMAELRHAGAATTEEDIPQQWFGMAESDFADDDDHPLAALALAPESTPTPVPASACSSHVFAGNANTSPAAHPPVTIDVP